jgi:hypothetical protein
VINGFITLNSTKTNYKIFTTAGKHKNYERLYSIDLYSNQNKKTIEPFPKFLGITFDPKLSFKIISMK